MCGGIEIAYSRCGIPFPSSRKTESTRALNSGEEPRLFFWVITTSRRNYKEKPGNDEEITPNSRVSNELFGLMCEEPRTSFANAQYVRG